MTGKIFVNMTDKFLSGWPCPSRGRSLYCIECDTLEQAHAVERAAQDRPEMKYIAIAASPRRARAGDHLRIVRFEDLGGSWLNYYGPARPVGRLGAVMTRFRDVYGEAVDAPVNAVLYEMTDGGDTVRGKGLCAYLALVPAVLAELQRFDDTRHLDAATVRPAVRKWAEVNEGRVDPWKR